LSGAYAPFLCVAPPRALIRKTSGYSAENSEAIFIRGGEPWLMSYCWRPPSAENCASHMSSLKAQEHGKSEALNAAIVHGGRLTNSIRALTVHLGRTTRFRERLALLLLIDFQLFCDRTTLLRCCLILPPGWEPTPIAYLDINLKKLKVTPSNLRLTMYLVLVS
jgi:hypothetical protein